MRRREFITSSAVVTTAWPLAARAQQPDQMRRIGVLLAVAESDVDVSKGIGIFQQTLQELGWKVGHNTRIDYRWGNADPERIQTLAKELVDLKPRCSGRPLNTFGQGPFEIYPLEPYRFPHGYRSTGSRPGRKPLASRRQYHRFLGVRVFTRQQMARNAQTDRPGHSTDHLYFQPSDRALLRTLSKGDQRSCAFLGGRINCSSVHSETDIENAIRKVGSEPDSALFVLPDSHNVVYRKKIIELAAHYRLPTIYYFRYFASDGGLISYGPDEMDLFRRTAGYVDRILRGTNPSDLPVQQPTKFDLVINLKTAKAMGIHIPVSLIARADEVIE